MELSLDKVIEAGRRKCDWLKNNPSGTFLPHLFILHWFRLQVKLITLNEYSYFLISFPLITIKENSYIDLSLIRLLSIHQKPMVAPCNVSA